jgi:hypothetical protein
MYKIIEEACTLAQLFTQLGFLYRANVCIDIALEHLLNLREEDKTNVKNVNISLRKKIKYCLRAKQHMLNKISQRKLIKIYLFSE